ncbi:type II toxin-antitoxin system VapC family toxin [Streptomyces echinoruber]|uniref:Ribonuclease VapC n=1 Tax=Streptomyces echinoruber TaxID=68898 RepID=A0A918VNK1_9ACTN|nr:type II toxin-antitoxin system VapC family toxin [Streptomyces echinoruber]GHA12676.1 ribonuclease VapC [Streptomyces echinoruber]
MIYLDSSALITWVTRRDYHSQLDAFLEGRPPAPFATSTIGFVETVRTLDLMGDFPTAMDDLQRDITEILVTEEVRDRAAALPGRLRTLDALHVASALTLGDALHCLVTYDKRMLEAARAAALPAYAPGRAD